MMRMNLITELETRCNLVKNNIQYFYQGGFNMKFSNGICARLTFKDEDGLTFRQYSSELVYIGLESRYGHEVAADAQGWTEVASIGELYEHDKFEIEMMEE